MPLPEDLDECDAYILAVVGLNRAGKTYFLASALNGAARKSGLKDYGISGFTPLEDTATRLHRDYYQQLFRIDQVLPTTTYLAHVEKQPLMFRVEAERTAPFILVTHDVSGEALMSTNDRAVTASFLRRADAMIFIVDPLDIDSLAWKLADLVSPAENQLRDLNQDALFNMVIRELEPSSRSAPLAVALSKSDLVSQSLGRAFLFASRATNPDWLGDLRAVNAEVRTLLEELGEYSLLDLADSHAGAARVTFHAISVLGHSQERARVGGRPAPIRVMDPLATVLLGLRSRIASR